MKTFEMDLQYLNKRPSNAFKLFFYKVIECTKHEINISKQRRKYLILMSIPLRLVGVWVMFEKLSHVRHDGLLIRLVHIHIYRAKDSSYCYTP